MKKITTIAITGHRDMIETKELRQKVFNFFKEQLEKSEELVLLSPLWQMGLTDLLQRYFWNCKKRMDI